MIRAHIAGKKRPNTWFGRLIQFILVAAVLTLGLMFSIVIIPTVIFLGLMIWSYMWKTRSLREQLKAAAEQSGQYHESTSATSKTQNNDLIIEGEATRIDSDKSV